MDSKPEDPHHGTLQGWTEQDTKKARGRDSAGSGRVRRQGVALVWVEQDEGGAGGKERVGGGRRFVTEDGSRKGGVWCGPLRGDHQELVWGGGLHHRQAVS